MRSALIIFFLIGALFQSGFSQDFKLCEAWFSYDVNYSVNKKWKLYGQTQWRPNNYSEIANPFLLELGARKKVNKVFSMKFQYRYIFINGSRNAQRLAMDARFKWKTSSKKISIKYRTRLQVKRVNVNGQIISGFRNKIGVEQKLSKPFSLYLDLENFVELLKITSFIRTENPSLTKNRYTLGAKYKMERLEFNMFYRIDHPLNSHKNLIHILGLGVSRTLN